LGPKAKIDKIIKQFPEFAEQFPEIPSLVYKALDNAAHAKEQTERQNRELMLLREQMKQNHHNTLWTMLVSAVIISAAVFLK